MDDITAAKILISCLDLTSLNDKDDEESINNLCQKAFTPWGHIAAICVYPRFIPQVLQETSGHNIKIATVVNFPQGGTDFQRMSTEIRRAISSGADEIDAVFPYNSFLNKDFDSCQEFLKIARNECGEHTLKIILETGELARPNLITLATEMSIAAGADFIKTSTGKTPVSATPESANLILENIAETKRGNIGFKASGGIKTLEQAKKYLTLAQAIMGARWVNAEHFRIGASSLIDDLQATIQRGY